MSETILRQLAMLRAVPRAPRSTTAATLKAHLDDEGFAVDLRSVQRDLETLSAIFPLLCDDTSKPYAWSWEKNALRELPGMDVPTALTFALADRFLDHLMPLSSLDFLRPYFQSADNTLKALSHQNLAAWPEKVRVLPRGQRLIPAQVSAEVLQVVYEALLTGRRFSCLYHRKTDVAPKRFEVSPLGLVVRDSVTYLVATLWDYGNLRQLTLHRMTEPTPLDTPVATVEGFDLDSYIAGGAFGYKITEHPIRLKARFAEYAARHLAQTALSSDQTLREEEGTDAVILEATVLDTEELRWWLLGFGDQVEVLEPEELRDDFRVAAETLCRRYR